jgi:hypothetical protein
MAAGFFGGRGVACEKLGAVHLLLHGIWAFKVNAAGKRTELVFQEPVSDGGAGPQYADGLVLTEWKLAPDGAAKHFKNARSQARRYAQGSLAGNDWRLIGTRSSSHLTTSAFLPM